MKMTEIRPNLFLATFENQYDCSSTFMKLQEFYESPYKKIRGKYFLLEEYMDLYANDNNNKFSYLTDWSGFNVPGNVVKKFYCKFMGKHTLSKKEKSLISPLVKMGTDFYLIGCMEKDKSTMKHEIAHGMFYLIKDYKKEMNTLIDNKRKSVKTCKEILLEMGYCKQVLNDEVQAYFATGLTTKMKCEINDKEYINQFKKVFKKYDRTN